MRTNFLQRSRKRDVRITIVLIFCVLAFLLIVLGKPLGTVASVFFSPITSLKSWIAASEQAVPRYIRSKESTAARIHALEAEVAALKAGVVRLSVLEAEQAGIYGLVGEASSTPRLISRVIRVPSETPYDTVVLESGRKEGVKEGALVYSEHSAIGTIARVYEESSIVVLFSTPGITTSVYLAGAQVFARAEGVGGGVLRIGVPQGVPLTVGEAVVIPVRGSTLYGVIDYIEAEASNPLQFAYVSQHEALRALRFVAIDPAPQPQVSYEQAREAVEALRSEAAVPPIASFETVVSEVPTTTPPSP